MYTLTGQDGKKWVLIEKNVNVIEEVKDTNFSVQQEIIKLYETKKDKRNQSIYLEKEIERLESEHYDAIHNKKNHSQSVDDMRALVNEILNEIDKYETIIEENAKWQREFPRQVNKLKEKCEWWVKMPFGYVYNGPDEYSVK